MDKDIVKYSPSIENDETRSLITDLRRIVEQARASVAATANYELTMMYWHMYWSHFVEVLPLQDELQREFYLTFASTEHWGVRRLRKEIDGMLYERTVAM